MELHRRHGLFCALLVLRFVGSSLQTSLSQCGVVYSSPSCSKLMVVSDASMASMAGGPDGHMSTNASSSVASIEQSLPLYQGILLLLSYGAIALFICIASRLLRRFVYNDGYLLDTFFDGGGNYNFAMVAVAAVTSWVWNTLFTFSTDIVQLSSLVGQFWYAAAGVINLLLFSIMAVEIRTKAPGAKTYLQVVKARFGTPAHLTLMVFALISTFILSGTVLAQGTYVFMSLTNGLASYVCVIIISILTAIFTVAGGMGGSIYISYVSCLVLFPIMLVFLFEVLYNPLGGQDKLLGGGVRALFDIVSCLNPPAVNSTSPINIAGMDRLLSSTSIVDGALIIISGFVPIFVDQSSFMMSACACPGHSTWGFLAGALTWFALPFSFAFTFGMVFLAMTVQNNQCPLDETDTFNGLLPVYATQQLMGNVGDLLMFVITMIAVFATVCGEVLSAASIVIYDIYQAYLKPFTPTSNKCIQEEYHEYSRRTVRLKQIVVVCAALLQIPVAMIMICLGLNLMWTFYFLGVLVGSCVIPIALSVAWHRTTGLGVICGVGIGFLVGVIGWLGYASRFPGGLSAFYDNTGRNEVMLLGNALSTGIGGLVCVVVSLISGGCDRSLKEETEWEATLAIDNPAYSWLERYGLTCGGAGAAKSVIDSQCRTNLLHAVRKSNVCHKIAAYVLGATLSAGVGVVWPAVMLLIGTFTYAIFQGWSMMILVYGVLATVFVYIVPTVYEAVQIYNSYSKRSSGSGKKSCQESCSTAIPSTVFTASSICDSSVSSPARILVNTSPMAISCDGFVAGKKGVEAGCVQMMNSQMANCQVVPSCSTALAPPVMIEHVYPDDVYNTGGGQCYNNGAYMRTNAGSMTGGDWKTTISLN